MPKFSVKRPMTVFVVVMIIIALGIVSLLGMTPDLMPSIDLPYVVVMTTYPGATPEEIEEQVTRPLEEGLATTERLESLQSISAANYSLVILEFEQDASMDSAVVDILQNVDLVEGSFDENIGSPYIMKINPNMLPVMIAAVDREGYDVEELSVLVRDELTDELRAVSGVASVSSGGLIESKINVSISEDKIEKLNTRLLDQASSSLAGAKAQINSGLGEIQKAEAELAEARKELDATRDSTYDKLAAVSAELDAAVAQASALATQISTMEYQQEALKAQLQYDPASEELQRQLADVTAELTRMMTDSQTANEQVAALKEAYRQAERGTYTAQDSLDAAYARLETAQSQLSGQKSSLNSALAQVNAAGNKALEEADLSAMLTMETVSGVLQGQNFSMPAGYIQGEDARYLVSVGDKMTSLEEVENQLLFELDGLGEVRLGDVADVFIADNSQSVYASINGHAGVLLTFAKQSNYPTATVSDNINEKFAELSAEYEGLTFTPLMDQGEYIYLIIASIGQSLGFGALFAIIILFIFLRDIKPTFIIMLSIPISILFALALMYFSGVTLNMMSLSGLAIAVGMLVDNSIVVIENTFRLRRLGVPAKKAAVAGAKQVAAAITSSTLTTVCVFAPIVFVQGITRQLFTDLALTISYSLLASLIIALTLVPSLSSTMFRREMKPEGRRFTAFKRGYMRLLAWNLRHKALVLIAALALLVFSVAASVAKGFIFIPDMATPQLSGTMVMNDEDARIEETKAAADKVLAAIETVDGVDTAAGMLSQTNMLTGETSGTAVSLYVLVDESSDRSGGEICAEIEEKCAGLDCTVEMLSASSLSSYTTAFGGSGVAVELYGSGDALQEAARQVGARLSEVEGIKAVDDGLSEAEPEIHFAVDKDAAMKHGLTAAQVYMQVAEALTYETSATTLSWEGDDYEVIVSEAAAADITLAELKALTLTGTGADGEATSVKLSEIASLEEKESLPSIMRADQRTYLTVTGELEEGYNITLVTEEAQKALSGYQPPEGVSLEFAGENEMIMEVLTTMLKMMGLGILFVYLIMVAQFQSLRSPFIVMFTIPLAFTGGLLALLIFDKEISVIAMIGLIMLVGIIVNNGIVLVDYINQIRARGTEKRRAIIEGSATRIRPVLMTSLTTILGLLIMAVGKTAGTDMMQPVALVSIGGLLYATALTLLVVPVIYDIFTGREYKHIKEEDLDVSDLVVE